MYSSNKTSFSSTSGLLPSSGPEYPLQSYSYHPPPPTAWSTPPTGGSLNDQKVVPNYGDVDVAGAGTGAGTERQRYPRIKPSTILIRLLPILVVNLLLEALFAWILKFYGNKKILLGPDRRFFNMSSLLVATALSMGIGYLLGEIGFMFRGSMLGKSDNTKTEIAQILHGTLGSYCSVVWAHIRRRAYTHATTLAVLFVVGNILGRLSVGWVGLTYAVDDTEVSVVDALHGTWWPDVGESLRKKGVFESPTMGVPALQDVLRTVATAVPFPQTAEIETNDKGDGDIKDWSFLDVSNLTRVNNAGEGTVEYTYDFQDDGGDPAIRDNRTLKVVGQCELTTISKFLDSYDFKSTTFYPTEEKASYVGDSTVDSVFGWILYSHPRDGSNCGPSCIYLGIGEGSDLTGGISDRWGLTTDGYSCRISVEYTSSVDWGTRPHVAPSADTLQMLSSFLVGDGSSHDVGKSKTNVSNISVNQKWLTPWGVDRRYPRDPNPPAMGFAGVLARTVAIVTQRLGDGLDKEEILPTKLTAAGLLSISWKWVAVVLGALAVVQLLIIVIATFLASGSLDLEDDLELLDGLLANHRFPGRNEPERVADKPWIKRVATSTGSKSGEAQLVYRFKGGTWGRLDADAIDVGKRF